MCIMHSYIFLTPVYPKNLKQVSLYPNFRYNKNALQEAVECLNQIVDVTDYLHRKDFSQNDVKVKNILISDNNTAILDDFGFLDSTKTKIK